MWDISGYMKRNFDDTIGKYNLWLKAIPNRKTKINFFDTPTSLARPTTTRALLLLFASYGLLVHQMDVKMTFLNR
jgi:hypothetical protein